MNQVHSLRDADLVSQISGLKDVLLASELTRQMLERAAKLELPHWYLGAGAVAQTIWNLVHGFDAAAHIKDCDLVYFDQSHLTYESEDAYVQRANDLFRDLAVRVEVINEARVHLWYQSKFGVRLEPYKSVEAAIRTWPTTATSVGVRLDEHGNFRVYAPYGLSDLFGLVVRPNRTLVTREVYQEKATRWKTAWPDLTVLPWEQSG